MNIYNMTQMHICSRLDFNAPVLDLSFAVSLMMVTFSFKFVRRYLKATYELCPQLGFVPKLRPLMKVPGEYLSWVMSVKSWMTHGQ